MNNLTNTTLSLLTLTILLTCGTAFSQEFGDYSFVPIPGNPHDVVHDSARGLAYVSNRSLDQIDIVSLTDGTLQTPIPVGDMPTGLAITPDGSQLLVALYNEERMAVVDLGSQTLLRKINLPPGRSRNWPLRVDFDSQGTCIWRDGGPGNPYGYVYTLDLTTDISTRLVPSGPDIKYSPSQDGSRFIFMFDYAKAAIWDADSQTVSALQAMPDFGSGWSSWITQGAITNDGETIFLNRAGEETLVYDGSYNYHGIFEGMAWGTIGSIGEILIMVESAGDEAASERISIWDIETLSKLDTLVMPESIGVNEYNLGSKPIDLSKDGQWFFAVGQTGLYIIDTSGIWLHPAVEVSVDIKPGSCPNPVNVKSKGVLPVAILGSDVVDANAIVATSVRLAGVAPIRDSLDDVAGPATDPNECGCTTAGPDGFIDLTLKFDTREIVAAIGEVSHGDVVTLPLTGVLRDETPFEGSDCVLIRGKFKPINNADVNEDGVVDGVDLSIVAENWLQSSIIDE